MTPTMQEKLQHWQDLREDFRICFDRAADLLATVNCPWAIVGRDVFRLAERSIIKVFDRMIEGKILTSTSEDAYESAI